MLELRTRVPRSLQSLKHSSSSHSRGTESSRQHDGHRAGAHAVARDAAGGAGGDPTRSDPASARLPGKSADAQFWLNWWIQVAVGRGMASGMTAPRRCDITWS